MKFDSSGVIVQLFNYTNMFQAYWNKWTWNLLLKNLLNFSQSNLNTYFILAQLLHKVEYIYVLS